MFYRVKNWGELQHYKDRSPAWLKLHKSLLDDYEFQCLPVASRALAPMLWLLASEYKDPSEGIIDGNNKKIAFRLRMTVKEVEEAINPLINAGFIDVEHDASTMLAEPERDASPETYREEDIENIDKTETETETDPCVPEEIETAVSEWNALASELNLPLVQKLSRLRKTKLRCRLRDCGGIDGWKAALAKVRESPGLLGENDRNWKADFDFLMKESSFIKLMEGKYDDWKPRKTGSELHKQQLQEWVDGR